MVYLFIGEDALGKEAQLKALRGELLSKGTEQFNLDILYSKEISLKELQEKLIYLPVKNPKRIVVIKEAQGLKEDVKGFILKFAKQPNKDAILVLDMLSPQRQDGFLNQLSLNAKVVRFKETRPLDVFALNRQIAVGKTDYALKVLNQLLKDGQRPEMILGGLRYAWEREAASPLQTQRRLRLLLNCDIEIKTGRLKPNFALEKLVVSLCAAGKPLH